jgi:hypothetical protein
MVRNKLPSGSQPYGRETWLSQERAFDCSQPTADSRQIPIPIHPPHSIALSVEQSLKECARVPVKEFALYVILENGREGTFTSGNLTSFQPKIFSPHFKSEFEKCVRKASMEASFSNTGVYNQDSGYSDLGFESNPNARNLSCIDTSSGKRRRHRPRYHNSSDTDEESSDTKKTKKHHRQYGFGDDPSPPIIERKTQSLRIGDEEEVGNLYTLRFRDMQQYACKLIGKIFVKVIEPRKQTHYPYTKGMEKAPPWWPVGTGDKHVRHKEPDHLYKPERVRLVVSIVEMVTRPYADQPAAIQKAGLNVKKLEEITMEAMSNWFNDKEHPKNAAKRPFLREIFKVARFQERYRNGELNSDFYVTVMDKDKNGIPVSDDEEDDIEEMNEDEEDDNDEAQPKAESPTILTPHSSSPISPSMIQTQQAGHHHDENVYGTSQNHAARFSSQPMKHASSSYMTEPSFAPRLSVSFDQSTSLQPVDHAQRSMSVSSLNVNYQTSPQATNFGWQNSFGATTTGSPAAPYYVTSPQAQYYGPQQTYQLPPPNSQSTIMSAHSHNMHHNFDGLPHRTQYEVAQPLNPQLRTSSLGHPHLGSHHGGYGDMFPDANNYQDAHLKEDPHMHHG